jgi:hypothetical protein
MTNANLDRFKVGDIVQCPADRGDAAFKAQVVHVGDGTAKNIRDVEYRWITVKRLDGRAGGGVWPSHRLS